MKLAVIDHIGNPGGGSRVVRALLPAFKALRPDVEITYFGNRVSMQREDMEAEFASLGIRLEMLNSVRLVNEGVFGIKRSITLVRLLQGKYLKYISFLPPFFTGAVHEEIEQLVKGFDLAFFPWPFFMECPQLDCPMVGIFHDFNYKYYFSGVPTFGASQLEVLNRQIPAWLKKTVPVVSTNYMAGELAKFYPDYADKLNIIHLSSMSTMTTINVDTAIKIVSELGINKTYILYPTNLCAHKNIGPLLAAIPIIKNRGHDVVLVLTGPDVEKINGHACETGVESGLGVQDVFGLGYVTNRQMDALIQCASVVVSTSLYEAGNGPGVDAWARKVPVAMSNIPAFTEHIRVQDVRAEVFDPRSPQDIADKIGNILTDPEKAKTDALHSQEAMKKITWLHTAANYLAVFDNAMRGARRD